MTKKKITADDLKVSLEKIHSAQVKGSSDASRNTCDVDTTCDTGTTDPTKVTREECDTGTCIQPTNGCVTNETCLNTDNGCNTSVSVQLQCCELTRQNTCQNSVNNCATNYCESKDYCKPTAADTCLGTLHECIKSVNFCMLTQKCAK